MYLRACSRDVHAAAIYGAETLAVSPLYGGSNTLATIFISVTATLWKWEPAEWEPSSPRLAVPREYYLHIRIIRAILRLRDTRSLSFSLVCSFIYLLLCLFLFVVFLVLSTYLCRLPYWKNVYIHKSAYLCTLYRSDDRYWYTDIKK